MGSTETIVVLLGAFAGGFVSGLTGFGTSLTALGIWLFVLPPSLAATLVLVCSVVSQALTLPTIWHAIDVKRVAPFILPGLLGVPLGTVLLTHIDVRLFKVIVGALVLLFSITMLLARADRKFTWGGRVADGAIGFAGGILGGLAGLSGLLPTIWASFRGWQKDERRAVFQAFNFSILAVALLSHTITGLVTTDVLMTASGALPGTIGGAWLGARTYRGLSDRQFRDIVLVLLSVSGSLLVWSNL